MAQFSDQYLRLLAEKFPDHSAVTTEIMLKRKSSESGKEFARKYVDKRISATGTLYAPCGGIHNVTETVMDLKEIKVMK